MSIVDIEPDELDIFQDKQTKALTGLNNIKNSHIEHLKVLESLLKNQSNTVIQLQKQLALARESENTLKEEIQSARKILNSLTNEIDNSEKNGQYILNTMKTYTRLHKYTDIHSAGQIQSHQSSEDAPIINVKVEQGSNNHTTFTSHTKRSELLPDSSNTISPSHEVAKKESSISFTTIFDRPKPIPSIPFNLSESDSRSLQQTVKTVHELPVMSTKPNRSEKQTTEHQAPKSPVIKLEFEYSKDSTEIANKSVEVSTVRVKRETDDSTGFGNDKRVKVEQLGSQLNSSYQDVFMVKLKQLQSDSGLGNGQTVKIARKIASESICYYYNALGCERDESLCMLDHVCAYCSLDHPLHLCPHAHQWQVCIPHNFSSSCKAQNCKRDHRCFKCGDTKHIFKDCQIRNASMIPWTQICKKWNQSCLTRYHQDPSCRLSHRCLRCGGRDHSAMLCESNCENYNMKNSIG